MKKTLLQLVQEVLESIDGDEVNSYADTTESLAVASLIRDVYWDIIASTEFTASKGPYQLTATSNSTYPTVMYLPSTNLTLEWLMYDQTVDVTKPQNFRELIFLPLEEFLLRSYGQDQADANVVTYTITLPSGRTLRVLSRKDGPPRYYTTPDDQTVLFDSYLSTVDSVLQQTKTIAFGERYPSWNMIDSFIPDLPEKQFSILRNEAKATASSQLRQTTNSNAERRARKAWIISQKTGKKIANKILPALNSKNYAR